MDDNLLNDFLAECREHLEGIETDLLAIEEAGNNADVGLVNKVFRAAHSIKGGAAFFNFEKIKTLAHKIETILDMIRSRKMTPSAEVVNILLIAFDALRTLVNDPAMSNDLDISSHIASLQDLTSQNLAADQKKAIEQVVTLVSADGKHQASIAALDIQTADENNHYIYLLEYDLLHDVDRAGKSAVELLRSLSTMGVIIDSSINIASLGTLDDEPAKTIPATLVYRTILDPDIICDATEIGQEKIHLLHTPERLLPSPKTPAVTENPTSMVQHDVLAEPATDAAPEPSVPAKQSADDTSTPAHVRTQAGSPDTIRINVEALDTLMVQAGELVLSRNQLIDAIARDDKQAIKMSSQRISFVTSELQEAVMRTRLQPIGNVFNKFPRVVRDMAASLHKDLRLQIEGRDVELDKTIVEGLSDPLTHMVRNSADHGIESPAERQRAGKPAFGTIVLRAFHEAGQVTIEVSDDGNGIDTAKVVQKALAMGLITPERLKGMTVADKAALIFLPGLSTAQKVTETSGRGVGMDVVKANLDRLGGKVEIRTEPHAGTTFRIKLPLTLAIIPSLIIQEGDERYAIPQVNVVELLRIPAAKVKDRIQVVGDAEVVVLRGMVIPIVRFSTILGTINTYIDPQTGTVEIDRRNNIADRRSRHFPADDDDAASSTQASLGNENNRQEEADRRYHASSDMSIVIIATGLLQYGLVVGDLRNTEEIVVKPLGRHLKGLPEYAGATIMGDGEVALILDATGIALKAAITSVAATSGAKKAIESENIVQENTQALLLFSNLPDEQCAIPLNLVQRVEKISADKVEMKGNRRTMQYRKTSLPLIQLADVAQVGQVPLQDELAVVVSKIAGHEIGFLGMMPVSVVENSSTIDTVTHRQKGISGSAIIDNATVLMIDLHEVIDAVHPEWEIGKQTATTQGDSTVLLVEDSDFFRQQVKEYIEEAGYSVLAAKDGQDGWELLDANAGAVKIVVTDIEMPRMNGLEMSKKIRSDGRFTRLPIIALTSLASEDDEVKGKACGIDEYQVKLDRDRLIDGIRQKLEQTE